MCPHFPAILSTIRTDAPSEKGEAEKTSIRTFIYNNCSNCTVHTPSSNSTQLTPTPSSRPHLTNLPMGDGARPPGNFNFTASFNILALGASASPPDPSTGSQLSTTSQNPDDFDLQPRNESLSLNNNPHFHVTARSAGADDGAHAGIGGMRWEAIFILLPPICRPPLILITIMPPPPRWALINNEQPPLPPTGAIPRSGRRRTCGYNADAMGGNIHPVASHLPAASSFN